jgi:hypothetical protein
VVRVHLAPRTHARPNVTRREVRLPSVLGRTAVDSLSVTAFRRGLLVGAIAILVGVVVRLRAKGGVAPTSGGWRELEGTDFR